MKKLLLTFGTATLIATVTIALPTQSRAWGWGEGGGYWASEFRVEPHPMTSCDWWWGFQWRDYCRYHVRYYKDHQPVRHRRVIHVRG